MSLACPGLQNPWVTLSQGGESRACDCRDSRPRRAGSRRRELSSLEFLRLPSFQPLQFPGKPESYKQESQCSCKSWPSRKSVEKRLGAVLLSGARLSTGPPDDSSSQSMLSRWPSARSRPMLLGSGAKCNSEVSMGEGGWSRMAELLSI